MTTTAVAKRPLDILKGKMETPSVVGWLQKQIAASMNRNASQLINVVLHAASASPKLAECTPSSILAGLCVAAQIGLVPNTALGHAWLVPFTNKRKKGNQWIKVPEATLIIGYQGMVKLVFDASGVGLKAAAVYSGEPFEYNRAANPPVTLHKHATGQRGKLVYAYCLAHFASGLSTGEVYDETYIHERRARSRSYSYTDKDGNVIVKKDSPWVTDPEPMWLKTGVRAFTKLLPKGNDRRLERAIEVDRLDDSYTAQTSVLELMEEPLPEAGAFEEEDERTIEAANRAELGPGEEDVFQSWAAELRQATLMKDVGEVELRIGKAKLSPALQQRLGEVAEDQRQKIKGARP